MNTATLFIDLKRSLFKANIALNTGKKGDLRGNIILF